MASPPWGEGAKDCAPEVDTSEIIIVVYGFSVAVFQWMFSGVFQRMFTFQWHAPKDCHFPSGCSLTSSEGFPLDVSNGIVLRTKKSTPTPTTEPRVRNSLRAG